MAPFPPLFKHSFSTFDEQTYQHSPTPSNPCKHAPPPTFNTLIDNLSTTPPKTLWKTSWKLGSLEVWKLGFHAPLLHEDTKGTQGPGHFTVRPCGPHYRAHPLRFCPSLETQISQIDADFGRAGARRLSRMKRKFGLEGVGRRPTPRQGEVLPAPPARLRRANKHAEGGPRVYAKHTFGPEA